MIKLSAKQAISLAITMRKKKCLSWYDKLDPKRKSWCDSLKKEYKTGSYAHVSIESLRAVVNENLALSVSEQPFRVWLKDVPRVKRKTV